MPESHSVTIRWYGSNGDHERDSDTYEFDTGEELEAFLCGIEEAVGRSDFEVVEDEEEESDA